MNKFYIITNGAITDLERIVGEGDSVCAAWIDALGHPPRKAGTEDFAKRCWVKQLSQEEANKIKSTDAY